MPDLAVAYVDNDAIAVAQSNGCSRDEPATVVIDTDLVTRTKSRPPRPSAAGSTSQPIAVLTNGAISPRRISPMRPCPRNSRRRCVRASRPTATAPLP
ncbi:hypothetical protein [Amycolatopsis sp. cmx-4-54]|uniref:hypothetical protein n=1 Tax=Amycolatopsis sp. cmx-4-54 TaxID=2790936 RepID=UPI00397B9133